MFNIIITILHFYIHGRVNLLMNYVTNYIVINIIIILNELTTNGFYINIKRRCVFYRCLRSEKKKSFFNNFMKKKKLKIQRSFFRKRCK